MEAGELGGTTDSLSAGNALWGKAPASSFGSEKSASRDNSRGNAQMFGLVEFYILLKCHRCLDSFQSCATKTESGRRQH